MRPTLARLPRSIWALGFVSLCMDISSELIHSLLPLYLVTGLGVSLLTIGWIEGVAEGTASLMKLFSGVFSDRIRHRKRLTLAGYALGALTKPVFPLANGLSWIVGARWLDRVGKGIRGAPRDALVADITPKELLGAAYGLRQALDSIGALLGPALAILGMIWFADNLRSVLWLAVIPAFVAVGILIFGVREPKLAPHKDNKARPNLHSLKRLGSPTWRVVALAGWITLARFSEAFLVLRAADIGLALRHVPLVMMAMNLIYAGAAFPAGALTDRTSPRLLLACGLLVLIGADVLLALAHTTWLVFAGAALWGLHMALTQGLLAKLVADTAPAELRGSAFGAFHLVSGLALVAASSAAGALWQHSGPAATFLCGAALSAAGLLLLPWLLPAARAPLAETRPGA